MTEAADTLTPFETIDTTDMDAQKLAFIDEAEAVGSVPLPPSVKGVVKSGVAKARGAHPTILMDKLGERLAYERSGTRLYEALILKHGAAQAAEGDVLPTVSSFATGDAAAGSETPAETL